MRQFLSIFPIFTKIFGRISFENLWDVDVVIFQDYSTLALRKIHERNIIAKILFFDIEHNGYPVLIRTLASHSMENSLCPRAMYLYALKSTIRK